MKLTIEESLQTLDALRETWASDHGHALHERRAEALRIVLDLARKADRVVAGGNKCLATHEDIGCSCDGCAALRKALAP